MKKYSKNLLSILPAVILAATILTMPTYAASLTDIVKKVSEIGRQIIASLIFLAACGLAFLAFTRQSKIGGFVLIVIGIILAALVLSADALLAAGNQTVSDILS